MNEHPPYEGSNREQTDCPGEAIPIIKRTEESCVREYDCVLCLFCLSGQERDVAASVNRLGCGRALFPRKTKCYRGRNEWRREEAPILPGYVFVYLREDETERVYSLKEIPQVIRVLHYGAKEAWRLNGSDLTFADWVWHQNGTVGAMDAVQIGDFIQIVDTELKHLRGRVARMDRRKKTVMLELDGAGIINHVWLPYQVIQKIDAPPPADERADGA